MVYLSACPLCQGNKFTAFISCKDHTVSHETFQLQRCEKCGFVFTNPQPGEKELPRYYQSEAYISHSNKSLTLIDLVYKISRNFTLQWKYQIIQNHSLYEPSSVLDYGCGTGAFLQECQKHNLQVIGVEPSAMARAVAKQNTNTEIFQNLTEVKTKADIVSLWHVLEHVADLHGTVEALKTRLNENGTMFMAVPNHRSRDAQEYGKHWAGYDVPRHLWHFSRDTMETLLTRHHLSLVKVIPMRLDAYYVSLLSEKYKHETMRVSHMMKALARGWKSNQTARKSSEFSSLIYIARK